MAKSKSARSIIHPKVDQTKLLELLGYNLRRAYLRVGDGAGAAMRKLGLRPGEFSTLVLLLQNSGASRGVDI